MESNLVTEIENPGWNYKLVRYFLHHKQLSILLFLFIILAGSFAFSQLHTEGFPSVTVPIAVVSTPVPGAGPETIATTVTIPLEDALKDVKGLAQISSSSENSVSVIVVNFEPSTNINTAISDVRTKLAAVTLPEGTQTPNVFVPETGGAPFIVAVSGNKPLGELSLSSKKLADKLAPIAEVKSFKRISAISENVYIDLPLVYQNPDVIAQIKNATIAFPLGQAILDGSQVPVAAGSVVKTVDDIKALPISISAAGGQKEIHKLGAIASIYEGVDYGGQIHWAGYRSGNNFSTEKSLLYEITLQANTNLLAADKKVQSALQELARQDGDIHYTLVYNQADESRQQIKEIVEGAIGGKWNVHGPFANAGYIFGGIWLLVLVMLVFLDWRSALISTTAIPLSFLFTFIVLRAFGVQLNTITLFSLILVLGLIVDPAIVVLESIKRYVELGYKGEAAALRSISVIGNGVFMAALTSLIVFVPYAIVSGTFGQIIKYIPLTVIPALVASYFIPMLFLTWLGQKFLKPKTTIIADENDTSSLWRIARWFVKINRAILARRWLQIVVVILGIGIPVAVTAALFAGGKIHQVQFAQGPDNQFVSVSVPVATNLTEVQLVSASDRVESILAPYQKYMKSYFYGSLEGGSGSGALDITIILVPRNERDKSSSEIVQPLQTELQSAFGQFAIAEEVGNGPPQGQYPVSVKIYNNDAEKLKAAAQRVAAQLRSYSQVTLVKTDVDTENNNLTVTVDANRAANRGLSPVVVYGQLNSILSEKNVFKLGDKNVVVRTPKTDLPKTVADLSHVGVFGSQGPVQLADIAAVENTPVPNTIRRYSGEQYVEVDARVKDSRDTIAIQRNIDTWAKDNAASLGLTARAFENRAGTNEFEKSFQELFLAIALSILVTYVVFVLFFKSFVQPFIILFAVPLILIGVFPSLVAFNKGQFGFLEIIGIIMVIGIVENVGIFLIDFANRKMSEGMNKAEAIALSSGIRFRPIVLTKLTALAGLLPLAVFAPFWRGLSVVVIAGILSSGILSLFTTPVLYSWFTRKPKVAVEPLPDQPQLL